MCVDNALRSSDTYVSREISRIKLKARLGCDVVAKEASAGPQGPLKLEQPFRTGPN